MHRISLVVLALAAAGCRAVPAEAPAAGPAPDAFAIVAEADRLSAGDLWPGFDPRTVPVAIVDGERTILFRHPSPPDGFAPVPGRADAWAYAGRHPAVTANSSAEIGGVATATLMPARAGATVRERAGVLIHEAFHVFQRARHPGWSANEVELFTYPVDDGELLLLRRMETEALRRALAGGEASRCWAHGAVYARRERLARMPAGAAAYERATEKNEGLANYVETRATGVPDSAIVPAGGFPARAVRERGYATGTAWARLLDRARPGWREELAREDSAALDEMLAASVASPHRFPCMLQDEREAMRSAATADVAALREERRERRRAFLDGGGWTLVVEAPGPLFPQGFDPLNVDVVAPGEVLHGRWLRLGNDRGTVEVMDRAALTESAGAHPLFNGVRRLVVAGLPDEPVVREADGTTRIDASGVTATLEDAAIERSGRTITIRMPPAP